VRVDPTKKLAYVGGGALWEAVDKAGIEHGLATVGGTVNHTGVGGLILGGGYGWLTGEHGLALDNLVQATVVTASGEIITANDAENADLFWALRGGGCNFGAVTEFVLQLHPQRRTVFGGIIAFPQPKINDAVATAAKHWEDGLTEKEALHYGQALDPAGNPIALFVLFWNGSEEEGRAHFKPFFDIGPVMDSCKEMPFEQINTLQNFNVQHGSNYYMKGVYSSGPQIPVTENLVSRLPELSASTGLRLVVVYEFFPTKKYLSVPNNATAYIRESRLNVLLLAVWDPKDTDKLGVVRSATSELARIIVDGEKTRPKAPDAGYGNYDSEDIASAVEGTSRLSAGAEALFGENYARLQKIKQKYDPDLFFFKWRPINPQA